MASLNHLHTYERLEAGRKCKEYRCVDPDCTHTSKVKFLLGKRARCRCGEAFILSSTVDPDFKTRVLKCPMCRDTKASRELKVAKGIFDSVMAQASVMDDLILKKPKPEPKQLELPPEIESALLDLGEPEKEESEVDWDD